MTWKKTKIQRLLRTEDSWGTEDSWAEVKLMRPYRERNYRIRDVPAGWRQMCKAVGLRPDGGKKRSESWLHLIGRGRHWRVNASRKFDMSVPHADFDRWAISTARTFPLPKNKTELELYVRFTDHDT